MIDINPAAICFIWLIFVCLIFVVVGTFFQ